MAVTTIRDRSENCQRGTEGTVGRRNLSPRRNRRPPIANLKSRNVSLGDKMTSITIHGPSKLMKMPIYLTTPNDSEQNKIDLID